jgi:hypothetical protein
MTSFKIQFDAKVTDTFNQANAIFALGVDELFNQVITDTPVDTGFARASWWKSVNNVGTHPSPPVEVEKGQSVAQSPQLGSQLNKITLTDKAFLSTSCVYMKRLEFYGHSNQRPRGWIRVILGESDKYFKQARIIVKRKGIK